MIAIRRDLARAGYVAHGWSHNFAAGPGDAEAIVSWWKGCCAVGLSATGYTVLWVQDFGRPRQPRSATLVRP